MKFRDLLEGRLKPVISISIVQKFLSKSKSKFLNNKVKTKEIINLLQYTLESQLSHLDIEFEVETEKVSDLSGEFVISGSYDEFDEMLTIYFHYTDKEILIIPLLWNYLYKDFPGFIKHEVLHYQQTLTRDKDGFVNPSSKKYIPGNLTHSDEIEAYAMNAADEIFDAFGKNSIEILTKDIKKTYKVSDSMNDYRLNVKDKKTTKLFLKKVIAYLHDLM